MGKYRDNPAAVAALAWRAAAQETPVLAAFIAVAREVLG